MSLAGVTQGTVAAAIGVTQAYVNAVARQVVPQFEIRFLYGPRGPGGGVPASMRSTIHAASRSVSVRPAACAGDVRSVLWIRQKLKNTV